MCVCKMPYIIIFLLNFEDETLSRSSDSLKDSAPNIQTFRRNKRLVRWLGKVVASLLSFCAGGRRARGWLAVDSIFFLHSLQNVKKVVHRCRLVSHDGATHF